VEADGKNVQIRNLPLASVGLHPVSDRNREDPLAVVGGQEVSIESDTSPSPDTEGSVVVRIDVGLNTILGHRETLTTSCDRKYLVQLLFLRTAGYDKVSRPEKIINVLKGKTFYGAFVYTSSQIDQA
jgi:hypothetical protein